MKEVHQSTPRDLQNNDSDSDNKLRPTKILIIGAGYAGLTMANLLQMSSSTSLQQRDDDENHHQHHSRAVWDIDVIDRLHPPPSSSSSSSSSQNHRRTNITNDHNNHDDCTNVIHGTIRVPFAKYVLPRMSNLNAARVQNLLQQQQQQQKQECTPKGDHNDDRLSETDLLNILRENIHVHYHHQAQSIRVQSSSSSSSSERENDPTPKIFVEILKRSKVSSSSSPSDNDDDDNNNNNNDHHAVVDEIVTWWGPYDWVIAADGALSKFRRCHFEGLLPSLPLSSSFFWKTACPCHRHRHRVLLLGDAQWVHGRWWDLGTRRLHCGADTALRQAYELAQILRRTRTDAHRRRTTSTTTATTTTTTTTTTNKQDVHPYCSRCGSFQDPAIYKFQCRSTVLVLWWIFLFPTLAWTIVMLYYFIPM